MNTVQIFFLLIAFSLPEFSEDQARTIAQRSSEVLLLESSEMTATLNIYDGKGNVRTRQVANASKKFGETVKTMIRFLAPADVAGTTMLVFDYENRDDDLWIYLPAMRTTRRIVSSEKGKSFMGSEFSNADMSKPNLDDYTYRLVGEEQVGDETCWLVESVCKTGTLASENGFSKKVAAIEKKTYLPRVVSYYDQQGVRFKEMTLSDYRLQGKDRYFAFRMEMKNLRNNRRSEMIINQFQLGSNLKESDFSTVNFGK